MLCCRPRPKLKKRCRLLLALRRRQRNVEGSLARPVQRVAAINCRPNLRVQRAWNDVSLSRNTQRIREAGRKQARRQKTLSSDIEFREYDDSLPHSCCDENVDSFGQGIAAAPTIFVHVDHYKSCCKLTADQIGQRMPEVDRSFETKRCIAFLVG